MSARVRNALQQLLRVIDQNGQAPEVLAEAHAALAEPLPVAVAFRKDVGGGQWAYSPVMIDDTWQPMVAGVLVAQPTVINAKPASFGARGAS